MSGERGANVVALTNDEPEDDNLDPDTDRPTDHYAASCFLDKYADRFRYARGLGWLKWDGRRWDFGESASDDSAAERAAMELGFDTQLQAIKEARGVDQKAQLSLGSRLRNLASMRRALEVAALDERVRCSVSDFDAQPWALNVRNGTLDLRTGELTPHDRAGMHRKLAGTEWNPDARAPQWDAFLKRVLPDDEVRVYVQRVVGYSLTGDTSAECMFILTGGGANGKSVFVETIAAMVGEYAGTLQEGAILETRQSADQALMNLPGIRMARATDMMSGRLRQENLKQLISGELVWGRQLYSDAFEFRPHAKLVVSCNELPNIPGVDDGQWRRLKVIEFKQRIPEAERNPRLRWPDSLLADELPGILVWAVAGAIGWYENGGGLAGLQEPSGITEASAEYRKAEHPLTEFFEQACEIRGGASCSVSELFGTYQRWCTVGNQRQRFRTEATFSKKLVTDPRFNRDRLSSGTRMIEGICLRSPERDGRDRDSYDS